MIKRYLECYIPVTCCNLKCHYCYIAQLDQFKEKPPRFKYSVEHIKKCLTTERLGGVCLINLCGGGETLIPNETIEIIRALLENGHCVTVVTNGLLSKRFEQISKFPRDLLSRLFFKFSFHYLELKRLNLFDTYWNNIKLMDSVGVSFTVELPTNDEIVPYVDDIKKVCLDNIGALCQVTISRKDNDPYIGHLSDMNFMDFCDFWEKNIPSDMFSYKKTIFYQRRKEFCYAGDWSIYIDMGTGKANQCYAGISLGDIFKNPDKPIRFCAIGCNCTQPHCYNGHVYLTTGNIPEIHTIDYLQIRNRKTNNGMVWVKPEMEKAFKSLLFEENEEYSTSRKIKSNIIGFPNKILKKGVFIYRVLKNKIRKNV